MNQTFYEILEVSESATQEEIKRAYRRLAKKYHPDHNKQKDAEDRFKAINRAYQVLGNPGRRQIYDQILRGSSQGRAAGPSSSASAGAQPPPPPKPPPSSAGTQAHAAPPPPPPAQGAYRYLFFLRGVLVGGGAVAALLVLSLIFYASCRRSPQAASYSPPPQPVSVPSQQVPPTAILQAPEPTPVLVEPTPPAPEATLAVPEPPPTVTEFLRLREQEPPTPTRAPVSSEPTAAPTPVPTPTPAEEQTAASSPVHVCGCWRGSFEWNGKRVPFVMVLEQRGSEISGDWSETRDHGIFRASIRGEIEGSTLTIALRYDLTPRLVRNRRSVSTARYLSSDVSPDFLRGNWEAADGQGSWRATCGKESAGGRFRNESWRSRRSFGR